MEWFAGGKLEIRRGMKNRPCTSLVVGRYLLPRPQGFRAASAPCSEDFSAALPTIYSKVKCTRDALEFCPVTVDKLDPNDQSGVASGAVLIYGKGRIFVVLAVNLSYPSTESIKILESVSLCLAVI